MAQRSHHAMAQRSNDAMAQRRNKSVPGFRSFWETSKKKAAAQNLTFVQVDAEQAGGARRKSSTKGKDAVTFVETSDRRGSDSQPPPNRRQQVYQAQKRHRLRKAEYAQSLEQEIEQVKYLHSLASADAQRFASENAAINQYLVSQGLLTESDRAPSLQLFPTAQTHLDPNLDVDPNNLFDMSSEPDSTSDGSTNDMEDDGRSRSGESYVLLTESRFPDPRTEAASQSKIKHCQELLMKGVQPFGPDEEDDKKTWKGLADLILRER